MTTTLFLRIIQPLIFLALCHTARSQLDVVKPGTYEVKASRYTAEYPGLSASNYLVGGTKIELTGDELELQGILWGELTSGDWIAYNGLKMIETKIIDGPPPVLQIDAETISFEDENGNGKIDANENCHINFDILNVGPCNRIDSRNSIYGQRGGSD